MKNFIDKLRQVASEENLEETPDSTNLLLTKEEFVSKMLLEGDGALLLDMLQQGEWRICERMHLVEGYWEEKKAYFKVPRWKALVAHLRIVASV